MQAVTLQQNQPHHPQPLQDQQLQLMTANLIKIKRQITQRNDQHTHKLTQQQKQQIQQLKHKQMNATRTTQLSQQIKQKYIQYLSHTTLPNNHEQKLQYLLEQANNNINTNNNNNMSIGIGISVALFEMLYYFRDVIADQILEQITQISFNKLIQSQSQSNTTNNSRLSMIEKTCLIQLISLCGVYKQHIISYIVQQMLQGRLQFQLCFILLSNMGYKGLQLLINLAKQDFKQIPMLILDHLSRTQQIIKQLLIPNLISDLQSVKNKGKQKDIILSILNRMNQCVSSNVQIFGLLVQMMQGNSGGGSGSGGANNDRGFVGSVLRSSGIQGEKILLQFMNNYQNNQKIMLPIVSVLPWRAPVEPVLRIKVIQYTLGSNFLPGTLYQYQGNIEPSAFCFEEDDCCDSLCINARDFIAALNRMLNNKLENYQNEQRIRKGPINNIKLFTLYDVIGKREQQSQITNTISTQVIRSLNKCLTNPKPQIREAAINSLGLIGLPQAYQSIEQITKCLWDKDSRNRSMACWALSKICEHPSKKIINRLIELLKDSFWKVRISACICIGSIVHQPFQHVIEALVRCLKDNSINKVTVCETIIKLGLFGEEILLEILKNTNQHDFKLKEAIIYSLREADVKNPHIDYVLEEIFKNCKGTRVETRENCLETLNQLRIKASQQGENIVYLKAKTILPFYYYFLEDPSIKIRQMATQAIFSFGGQAELIFIQGITKGSQAVRIQSAKGLAKLGIQNFRALILGLRDDDATVRKTTTQAILKTFTPQDVAGYYATKFQQVPSLLCNLKDILSGGTLTQNMKQFVKETIISLERISKDNSYVAQLSKIQYANKSSHLFEEFRDY